MRDDHWLPPRKAMLCRMAGLVFLLSALSMIGVIAFAGLTPGASPICGGGHGCAWRTNPMILLDQDVRMQVSASAPARQAFDAYVAQPWVRVALAGIDAIDTVPFALLLFGVGMGLRRLGGGSAQALVQALPWLRRASLAAVVWALADPVYETLLESLLSPGTPTGPQLQLVIYLGEVASGLLLAFAAYAAIWAIETGLRAQRDLDEFV